MASSMTKKAPEWWRGKSFNVMPHTHIVPFERRKEFEGRASEISRITKVLMQLQDKAMDEGLTIEERSLALKYEEQLNKWLEEDPTDWFVCGGVLDYSTVEGLHQVARALRRGHAVG